MGQITTQSNFPKSNQVPSEAILDINGKQVYLGNAFIMPVAGISLGTTAETAVALIVNAATSTKSLFITLRRVSSSLQPVMFKYYINPTITSAGTSVTPINLRPGNSNTSVATCTYSPTASANGKLFNTLACPSSYYVESDSSLMIILDPGYSLLATGTAQTSTTAVQSDISWFEL